MNLYSVPISLSDTETTIESILLIIDVFIVLSALKMLWHLGMNRSLANRARAFSVQHRYPLKKVLILGDSTAVGTGANRPEDTFSGKLARDIPQITIHNRATNGARVRDLLPTLQSIGSARYDLVIISIGGNDIWHLSSPAKLERQLSTILDWANRISGEHVVLLGYSNIGSAPLFPRWLRRYLGRRALRQRDIFRRAAHEKRVKFIDLLTDDSTDPFRQKPGVFFAKDGIHPSSAGYHLWYKMMWREIVLDPTCPWQPPGPTH